MNAARSPRKAEVRLLAIEEGEFLDSSFAALPDLLRPGDLLVVNDAATLPASLYGQDNRGNPVEIRLRAQLGERAWQAILFGAGDWRTPTEDRPSPPDLDAGDEIIFAADFRARVVRRNELSDRLLDLEFNLSGARLWRSIYQHGKPVQYAYMREALKLWSVQNVYSSRPWAVEMPSAGHALDWQLLLELIRKGVRVVALTHGAGLSSTGDAAIDGALPLAEPFDIPAATMEAIRLTRESGGRVIAVGTSVVRALESAGGALSGITHLKITSGHQLRLVDGLLTGSHEASESHYQLLHAFLPEPLLVRMSRHLEDHGYLTHEYGDCCLIIAGQRMAGGDVLRQPRESSTPDRRSEVMRST